MINQYSERTAAAWCNATRTCISQNCTYHSGLETDDWIRIAGGCIDAPERIPTGAMNHLFDGCQTLSFREEMFPGHDIRGYSGRPVGGFGRATRPSSPRSGATR